MRIFECAMSGVLLVIPDDSYVWKKACFMAQTDRRNATADRRTLQAQPENEPEGLQGRLDGEV